MGVNTNAIIRKGTTIEQIEKAISNKYTEVEVIAPSFNNKNYESSIKNRIRI